MPFWERVIAGTGTRGSDHVATAHANGSHGVKVPEIDNLYLDMNGKSKYNLPVVSFSLSTSPHVLTECEARSPTHHRMWWLNAACTCRDHSQLLTPKR